MSQKSSPPRNEFVDYYLQEAKPRHEAASPTHWMNLSNGHAAYAIAHQCMQP